MLKLFTITIFFLASASTAIGQAQTGEDLRGASSGYSQIPNPDSVSSIYESLPPLSLEPFHDDSESTVLMRPGVSSEFGSWMTAPVTGHANPLSLELLFGSSPYRLSNQFTSFQGGAWLSDSRTDLLISWKLELQSRQKYQLWRSILGSVQIGGMAYLMYLHFKEYGLK